MKYFKCEYCSNYDNSVNPCIAFVDEFTYPTTCLESNDADDYNSNWKEITKEQFIKETK